MLQEVRLLLEALNDKGYEAYTVGGAVRDLLLGKEAHDYDVTTSAKPDEIKAVASEQGWHIVEIQGTKFGVTLIVIHGVSIETATFRGEAYGSDSHRPEQVWYAQTLREDVLRRDFTINALAMDKEGRIYDYVGGQKDLKKKRLVTVGEPQRRFSEDALRLFRACRFTAQLDFLPDKAMLRAMPEAFSRVEGLSLERVHSEIEKLLLAPYAYKGLDILVRSGLGSCSCRKKHDGEYEPVPILPELAHLAQTPQSRPFHLFDAWFHTLAVVAHTPADLTLRYAALFHDIAKGLPGIRGIHDGRLTDYGHDEKGAEMAHAILSRWGVPEKMARRVAWLVKIHMKFHYFANTGQGDVDKWLRKEALKGPFNRSGELAEAVIQASQVAAADALGCGDGTADTSGTLAFGQFMAELAREMPVSVKDMVYDRRIPDMCGSKTKKCLQVLLKRIQNKDLENNADVLAEAAEKWLKRHQDEDDKKHA